MGSDISLGREGPGHPGANPAGGGRFRVGFRTPIQCRVGFPPAPDQLLRMIRARLIRLVNEYGDGSEVPEPEVEGGVRPITRHYHRLVGYSRRSGRREFWRCWTGIADYEFEDSMRSGAGSSGSEGCWGLARSPPSAVDSSRFARTRPRRSGDGIKCDLLRPPPRKEISTQLNRTIWPSLTCLGADF